MLASDPAFTRSRAERRLRALVLASDLPKPEVNVPIGPYEADLLWRPERLIVEADSYRFHSGRESFEHDCQRDFYLESQGFHVIRVTWANLQRDPAGTISLSAAVLRTGGRFEARPSAAAPQYTNACAR